MTDDKRKMKALIVFMLLLLITGCSTDGLPDDTNGDIVNVGDEVSENQIEKPSDDQMEEKEIVCENPYFFSPDVSSLTADITFCYDEGFSTRRGELELHWLKQYENGCVAKLSLLPFDNMPEYLSEEDINFYFYVTSDEIYRIYNYILQDSDYLSYGEEDHFPSVHPRSSTMEYVNAYEDEDLFFDLLDSDEKILENAELVCCLEGIESDYIREREDIYGGESGILYEIEVSENQITYRRYEYPAGNLEFYNSFVWESGKGLSRYRTGYRAEALILYIENITVKLPSDSDQTQNLSEEGSVLVSWEDAGMEDHIMDWKDENLQTAMERITGITERDIMLSDIWELTTLDLEAYYISDISALEGLLNIQILNLAYNYHINDISALGSLKNLQELNLEFNEVNDISALENLTGLQTLNLRGNHIMDINSVEKMTQLIYLDLSKNRIGELGALENLTNLQELHLDENYNIGDEIDIMYNIDDISVLGNLVNLQTLSLERNNISDISALSSLTNLQTLSLLHNHISDISALREMTDLQRLELQDNHITDISPLEDMDHLQVLNLWGNRISDINSLSNLHQLKTVDLSLNAIDDITPFSSMGNLEWINLSFNNISDVTPLGNLINMNFLDLSYNCITDISALGSLTNLTFLELKENDISDYSPVDFVDGLYY